MYWVLAQVGIGVALWAGNRWLWGDKEETPAKPHPESFGDFSMPRTEEGAPIPMFWGRVRVRAPIMADAFDFGNRAIGDDYPGTFQYFASMLFVLGVPPAQNEASRLTRWWVGSIKVGPWTPLTEDEGERQFFEPDLFGGIGQGGGVDSVYIAFRRGTSTQTLVGTNYNTFYSNRFDEDTHGYRGFAIVAMGDMDLGETLQVEPYHFEIECVPFGDESSAPAYYKVDGLDGDMNPVGVIHDILTSDWKMGLPESRIDLDSFEDAAETLAEEEHGFSMCVIDRTTAREIIEEVLTEIDATLYEEPNTGKFTLKLIRDDYDPETLDVYDESILTGPPRIDFDQFTETYNEVKVTFTNRVRGYDDDTRTAQDGASITSRGRVRSLAIHYPGVTSGATAARLATRDLRVASTPLKRVSFVADRRAATLRPGGCIKLSWAEYGLTEMIVRVTRVSAGTLDDGQVTVAGYQDVFGIAVSEQAVFDPDLPIGIDTGSEEVDRSIPPPVKARVVEEAARWLQRRAVISGRISDANEQHLMYLAAPNDKDDSYRVLVDIFGDNDSKPRDAPDQSFPPSGVLTSAYPRTAEPFDNSIGIDLEQVTTGFTLDDVGAGDIVLTGSNLCLLVSDAGEELIAFRTSIGTAPTITLTDVERGKLDTAAIDHPIGTRCYFLQQGGWLDASKRIGRREYDEDTAINTVTIVPRGAKRSIDRDECDTDRPSITRRTLLPYPVQDLEADGEKELIGDDRLIVGATTLTWKRRDRDNGSILAGTAADEGAIAGVTFTPYGVCPRLTEDPEFPDLAALDAATAGASNLTELGAAGHGEMLVSVRSTDTASRDSWTDPAVLIDAPHWRNLIRNGNFASGTTGWNATTGGIQVLNVVATSLGNNGSGYLVSTGGNPTTVRQTVQCAGFTDGLGLTARLSWYERNIGGDATDDLTATLEMLDDANTVLATVTVASHVPSTTVWTRNSTNLAMVAGTTKLRVTFVLAGDSTPESVVARVRLTLGQNTGSRLNNSSFETAALASWTTAAGDWRSSLTTSPYEQANYIAGGSTAATCELYQEDTVPTGHEGGSVALVEFACARDGSDTNDSGEVIVEARNAAGTVLATESLTVSPSTTNLTWEDNRIALDLPYATDHVRVRLRATRLGDGGNCNIAYDDVRLTYHKELQSRWEARLDFDAPVTQYMPATVARWWQDVTNAGGCRPPNAGFWNGTGPDSVLPGSPDLRDDGVSYITDFVGPWDGDGSIRNAIEFPDDTDLSLSAADQSFAFADRIAVAAWIKVDPARWADAATGIVGRLHAERGWSLELNASGTVRAKLIGTLATVTLDSVAVVTNGVPHFVALHHRQTDGLLYLIVDGVTVSTSTAAVGVVRSDPTPRTRFRIGRANNTQSVLPGQMARLYVWTGSTTYMPTAAQLAALYTHATDPSEQLDVIDPGINAADTVMVAVRTGTIVSQDSTNGNLFGHSLLRFKAGQVPIGYANRRMGLASGPAITARQPDTLALWTAQGALTLTSGVRDTEGMSNGLTISGISTDYLRGLLDLNATADVRVSVWVLVDATQDVKIELRNTSDVLIGAAVTTSVTAVTANGSTYWQRIDAMFTWDNSTADAYLRIYPSVDGTPRSFDVGHVLVHQDGAIYPMIWPAPMLGDQTMTAAVSWSISEAVTADPASRIGIEGEIHVIASCDHPPTLAMTIASLTGTGDDGRRTIRTDVAADLFYDAGNASGTVVTSEVAPTNSEWTGGITGSPYGIRAHWSRVGRVDDNAFGGLWFLTSADTYFHADNDIAAAITHELATPVSRFTIGPFVGALSRVTLRTREAERWQAVSF